MLAFEFDEYNGVIIRTADLPADTALFTSHLDALLSHTKSQNKAIVWLTLPIELAHLISAATVLGFTFHNCLSTEVTLIYKSKPEDFAPFVPTHSLGGGGFVQNSNNEILVIREKGMTGYKLPGGHIELGERIEDAVIREVFEETGIQCSFDEVIGMASTHPYRFGKSNIYMVCKLTPQSNDIAIQDTDEIEDAKWVAPAEYLSEDSNSVFNRYLVESLLLSKGLARSSLDLSQFSTRKHEVFLASNNS